jgi:hypothetical protein
MKTLPLSDIFRSLSRSAWTMLPRCPGLGDVPLDLRRFNFGVPTTIWPDSHSGRSGLGCSQRVFDSLAAVRRLSRGCGELPLRTRHQALRWGSLAAYRFQALCGLAGIKTGLDIETGKQEPWELKDLRKTCATNYDEHVPESSIEIIGHSVGGITYRHYAHRAPLAFRAIMTLPQPTAFSALLTGRDSECPCCRRRFADAG